jgi:hypothetical protein
MILKSKHIALLILLLLTGIQLTEAKKVKAPKESGILKADDFKHFVDYFNRMEDENIVQAIPNDSAWSWMKQNIPLFDCPQDNFLEMYYYRWWTYRKHIKQTPSGLALTEFLVQRSYSDKYNLIACAIGHHMYEGRWLRNNDFLEQYLKVWYRGNDGKPMAKLHKFSSWTPDAVYHKFLVDNDSTFIKEIFPDMEYDFNYWETTNKLENGLYWQEDVRDGMEESISGGRKVKNARPTINSYMFGNAKALSEMALICGDKLKAQKYSAKADEIKYLIQDKLWNSVNVFFETRNYKDSLAQVREAIGFIPWYFNLPDKGYEEAWLQVKDEKGFLAPYGLTTAERRHPAFRTHGVGNCEWDGAVWPFATSQTLTAMANLLNNYKQEFVNDSVFFKHLELYVESQYHRGRPYIGEYLDEVTGYWLKGDQERSRYYNHSTFNDLIINDLVGIRERSDNVLIVNPLIPQDKWGWFCLDGILYHGKKISVLWDKTGLHYNKGKGLIIFVNGVPVVSSAKLSRLRVEL